MKNELPGSVCICKYFFSSWEHLEWHQQSLFEKFCFHLNYLHAQNKYSIWLWQKKRIFFLILPGKIPSKELVAKVDNGDEKSSELLLLLSLNPIWGRLSYYNVHFWNELTLTRIVFGFMAPIPDSLTSCLKPSLKVPAIVTSTKALIFRWSTKEIQFACSTLMKKWVEIKKVKSQNFKGEFHYLNWISWQFFKIFLNDMSQNIESTFFQIVNKIYHRATVSGIFNLSNYLILLWVLSGLKWSFAQCKFA